MSSAAPLAGHVCSEEPLCVGAWCHTEGLFLSMRSRRSSKSASWALSASICARSSVGESAPGAAPAACEELLLAAPFMSAALLLLLPLKLLLLLWCQSRAATAQQGPLGARRFLSAAAVLLAGVEEARKATEARADRAADTHSCERPSKSKRERRPCKSARATAFFAALDLACRPHTSPSIAPSVPHILRHVVRR